MNRIEWLDNCKAIAIFLVVLGHFSFIDPELKTIVYAFHLPLFLFISGYLLTLNKDNAFQKIKSNIFVYIRIFIFFAILSIILWVIVSRPALIDIFSVVGKNLYGTHGQQKAFTHANGALWYLPFLVSSVVLYGLTWRLPKLFSFGILIVLTYVLAFLVETRLPWSLDASPVGAFFILMGATFRQYKLADRIYKASTLVKIISLGALALILTFVALNNSTVNINQLKFGNYIVLFYLAAVCGIVLFVIICTMLKSVKLIQMVGENTLIIFCLHLFFVKACRSTLAGINDDYRMLVILVLAFIITLILAVVGKLTIPYFKHYIMRK